MAKHFIDNKRFLAILLERRELVLQSKENGTEKPKVTDELGETLFKLATHLSYKANFLGYSYREDMIADGLENSLRYIDNFDPSKSNNPFAYFTQIMWCAFVRNIESEDKNLYIKYKSLQNYNDFDEYATNAGDDAAYNNSFVVHLRKNMGDIVGGFEEKQQRKKTKKEEKAIPKKPGGLMEKIS